MANSGSERLAETIRQRRAALRLSLQQVAERVGCARSYLSEIENGRREAPPSDGLLASLEAVMMLPAGELQTLARWARTPEPERTELSRRRQAGAELRNVIESLGEQSLDEAYRSGALQAIVDRLDPPLDQDKSISNSNLEASIPVGERVPLINSVAAGLPHDFTDLGYPARIADEYISAPGLNDPDAFAARVVGDSMQPEYQERDIVIFSPGASLRDGQDCFCRIEPDQETTFKRVFFERGPEGRELIRLQPLNSKYPPRVLERDRVAGLYAAVRVMREIG